MRGGAAKASTRTREAIEQAIARNEPTSRIMRTHGVSYRRVQEVRDALDKIASEVDVAAKAELMSECEHVYGSLADLERERRRVHLDRLASFRRQRRRAA